MSVEQTSVIDMIGINRDSGKVILTVSDHLPWDAKEHEHLLLLQEKINTYLRFIESGEVYREYPDALKHQFVIEVVGQYSLSEKAQAFYAAVTPVVRQSGFEISFEVLLK